MIATLQQLLDSLPEDQRESVKDNLEQRYHQICERLADYMQYDRHLNTFIQSGSQWIADFEVKDLSKPVLDQFNFHLQNTSQWVWAGCILVQDGHVSVHT